jgi:hypothetical protein
LDPSSGASGHQKQQQESKLRSGTAIGQECCHAQGRVAHGHQRQQEHKIQYISSEKEEPFAMTNPESRPKEQRITV